MTRFWRRLWAWLSRQRMIVPEDTPSIGHNRPPKAVVVNREDEGAHFYLGDILSQIKRLHRLLKRLRAVDREAYDFHGRIGARVLPAKAMILFSEMPRKLPSTGMTYMHAAPDGEWIPANFIYFTRTSKPIGVESFDGPIYRIAAAFSDGHRIFASSFHVGINGKTARPLRCICLDRGWRRYVGGRSAETTNRGWGIDPDLVSMFMDTKVKEPSLTLDEYVNNIARIAFNSWAIRATDELQVRVRRSDVTALFNVCTKRTPYFFKDRETGLAVDGKRKRIFHIVREHARKLKDGRVVTVPEHYRGERRFKWDGAAVTITVPDLHHGALEKMDLTALEIEPDDLAPVGTISNAEAGRRIAEHLS